MRKPTRRRIGLGVIQHIALALAVMIIVSLAQNSVISVENLYGEAKRHQLNLYEHEERFEDTAVFSDMFDNAVIDLTTLVVIKGQLETNGVYDGNKQIDVTSFVNRKEVVSQCSITAVYYLDDLIKWSKNGLSMTEKTFTKKDFVNFFYDDLLGIEHFYLDDETETLRYRGSLDTESTGNEFWEAPEAESRVLTEDEKNARDRKLTEIYNTYLEYNEDKLVDMAFSYLASHMDKPVKLSLEDNVELVHVDMLRPRYAAVDGEIQLVEIADNWLDYCMLENNLIDTIDSLAYNYELYESRNDLYSKGNTNLSYLVRVPAGESYIDYTNMAEEFLTEDTKEIDNYFEDIGKYISYSVDDIDCVGNVDITDEDMFNIVETHKYAYPEGTRIWIGVDTDFEIEGDQFETGYTAFNNVVPRMNEYVLFVCLCLVVWLLIWCYLTYTAGKAYTQDGEMRLYLNGFDRLYTEFVVVLSALLVYMESNVFSVMMSFALDQSIEWPRQFLAEHGDSVNHYLWLAGVVYGFVISFLFSIIWYSLVRRIKSGNIWKDSVLHWIWEKCYNGAAMVLYHRSTTVRTLIPYNMFLIVNLFGLAGVYTFEDRKYMVFAVLIALLVFDAVVGVILFRQNAEMADIVDAIKRIRQGEVDYKLETEKLHGENREVAEAVNNIGEGIKHAVATSMKDEQMKADLITNVSHDIKTPLTSIINYVDLLKRQKIEAEPIKTYIAILDTKSQRLKQLTDDLVEASKISSGNIVLEREKLNLTELFNQSIGEFSEKFEEKQLQIVFTSSDVEAYVYADSRRMWRIIENLFNNIYKYAMPVTRVYITVSVEDGRIEASLKNISQMQLNIKSDELTERFIRGDVARFTEGSGLGLSIAKSLTQVQGGEFHIYLDGDLFKVTLLFPEYDEAEVLEEKKAKEEEGSVH